MNYTVNVNGQNVEVSKEVYDEYRRNTPKARHERYITSESKKVEMPIILSADLYQNPSAEDEYLNKWNKVILFKALKSLNSEEVMIIIALFFKGKTERQLARYFGVSQVAVNKRKVKILSKLKKIIEI
jgi:RNA polymerase sigma factor (sigma-70 family)